MKPEYRYGLLCSAGLSGWVLMEFMLGFHTSSLEIGQYSGYVSIIVPVLVIYAALKEEELKNNGYISFKESISTGFQIAIYSAAIFSLFLYVYNNFVNPGWINSMIEWQRKRLVLGGAKDDEIERLMEQNRGMNNAFGQGIMSFLSLTGVGVFVTLVEISIIKLMSKNK